MTSQTSDVPKPRRAPVFEQALLSLNVAGAVLIAGLFYISKNLASWTPVNDSSYLVLRNAFRVVDFLRLQSQPPVATSALRRQWLSGSERLGIEVFMIVTLLGTAAVLGLLLWLLRKTPIYRSVKAFATLGALLFAAPACYLYVSWLTWRWPRNDPWSSPHGNFFRQSAPLMVFLAEIATGFLSRIFFRRKK